MYNRPLALLLMLLALSLGSAALVGCDDQGPAEEADEEIDGAIDDDEDAMDD